MVYAATRLIEVGEFRRLARFRRSELLLSLATTVSVLVFGVLYGIGVAIALSILDLLRRIARPHDGVLGYVPGLAGMHDALVKRNAIARRVQHFLVQEWKRDVVARCIHARVDRLLAIVRKADALACQLAHVRLHLNFAMADLV